MLHPLSVMCCVLAVMLAGLGAIGCLDPGSAVGRDFSRRALVYAAFFLMLAAILGLAYLLAQSAPVFHP